MPNEVLQRPQLRRGDLLARRLVGGHRTPLGSEGGLLVLFLVGILTLGLAVVRWPDDVPISLLFPVVVVAGLVLRPGPLLWVYGLGFVTVLFWMPVSGISYSRSALLALSLLAVMALMVFAARSRSLIGTRGFGSDRMFAELRDRIALVGRLPDLPDGWGAWSCIRSAHGEHFSGDFVVAHLSPSGYRLEIVLVDVSGKGTRAGTRSLLLSGALGGLLGAVPSADFLRAANDYLLRQGWEEGFATAVHLDLDLRTGEYSIANAGHPFPALYTSGRARWNLLDGARGPLLGVVPGASFPRQSGRLDRGDALLLYSDGIIEARGRDLVDGIDRMLGIAARSVLGDANVARDVCESARSGEDDDRAALAVRRL
ncbi:PP2C family protein-serine/threonine phosphatase [Fodinibacter luteus]|uniref:PP2C family protein-serine/threonine phosphatase n=1 Tax=Fodinibacter luteus TaxID=552064 RepID=A0ABP8KIQ9_9MICO